MRGFVIITLLLLAFSSGLFSEEAKKEATDWREAAHKAGLTEKELERLAGDKVLVGRREWKQSFSAYMGGELPSFITSDAVLNAYHVLFEETLRRQEEVNAGTLHSYISELWKQLAAMGGRYKGDAALIREAHQRARFVIGVAAKLLSDDISTAPEELRKAIDDEVAAIVRAEGQRKPAMLGPEEPDFVAFDYTVFRPAGFYTDAPAMEAYFRATRWLQLVPFRVEKREELLALHMMNEAMDNPGIELPEAKQKEMHEHVSAVGWSLYYMAESWRSYGIAHGVGALADSVRKGGPNRAPFDVNEEFLREIAKDFPNYLVDEKDVQEAATDRIRQAPGPGKPKAEARLIAALELPEHDALRRCMDLESADGPPCGLEVAAWLGLPHAEALLQAGSARNRLSVLLEERPKAVVEPDPFAANPSRIIKQSWEVVDEHWGVCWTQMHALRGLWELDKRAPQFLRGEPWQKKTLLTVTASWAQHRHAWALQSKLEIHYMAGISQPKALIEPVPEFFRHLADACDLMTRIARHAESQVDPVAAVEQELGPSKGPSAASLREAHGWRVPSNG